MAQAIIVMGVSGCGKSTVGALEEPTDAFTLDTGEPPGVLAGRIVGWVSAR